MPWLMKAEPDSRIVKGQDVKFSVDDFEKIGTSKWDGVRNREAKTIMKDKMKVGDKVLFYHSNTKVPGVFGLAEVAKEGYPDYTAWDPAHPYFDPKTDKANPTWYMVDVCFIERLPFPPTLALFRHLASISELPSEIDYIGEEGFRAIKGMVLVNRGRLSVQPVEERAYEAVVSLGKRGGWEGIIPVVKKVRKGKVVKGEVEDAGVEETVDGAEEDKVEGAEVQGSTKGKKRKRPGKKEEEELMELNEAEQATPASGAEGAQNDKDAGTITAKKGRKRKGNAVKEELPETGQNGQRKSKRNQR